ncbi:ABC transporter permease [Candidatus Saccharibacteria bacterium]|nr:ABC transporter permease [Candidatus Saccharibacteria bacterium]
MNVVTRGIKNALRSPLRSGAIILMLAISIGLILSMLVARSSVEAKINEVKSSAGTNITITPAGVSGFAGGGDPLTGDQVATITSTAHIASVTSTLSDQLGTSDTSLISSLELGSFGQRMMRFEDSNSSSTGSTNSTESSSHPAPTPRTSVTGTTNPNAVSTDGSSLNITSGETIDGKSIDLVALVGSDLATKNSLTVGSTFTAYGKTITVKGIFTTGNKFQDSGLIMPLASLQTLTDQTGNVTTVVAKIDSSDNVDATVTALKSSLGDKADIVSAAKQAEENVSSLSSISSLALAGVIGSTVAGAAIILLAMIMIVRERRREIGVIKAIGGTNQKVISQFITEAMTLTLFGAIIGLALGVVVSGPMTTSLVSSQTSSTTQNANVVRQGGPGEFMRGNFNRLSTNLSQITSSLTPQTFSAAVGITFLIAIIGSAIPAWFIARIRPAEVLRSE